MEAERKRVLVVGGSGYLGQHLLAALASSAGGGVGVDVAFTHHRDAAPPRLLDALPGIRAFRVDLRSGDGLEAVAASFGQVRPPFLLGATVLWHFVEHLCEVASGPSAAVSDVSLGYLCGNVAFRFLNTPQMASAHSAMAQVLWYLWFRVVENAKNVVPCCRSISELSSVGCVCGNGFL
jgi:NAD(P)-dependent dehydrogenase (short-subunit alcohol dehydrogenase family)